MLLMTLFDALAIASVSLGISVAAHAHTQRSALSRWSLKHLHVLNPRDQKFWHCSARFTCFSCCLRNLLKIHWNTPRGAVLLCAQNNCLSQTRCCSLTGLLRSVLRFSTNLLHLLTFSLCLVTSHTLCVLNLLCVFGNPSRSSSLVLQHSRNSRSSSFQLVLTFMSPCSSALLRAFHHFARELLLTP